MRAKSSGSCVAVARVLAMLSAASVPVTGQQPNEARRGQAPTTTQPGSIPRTADGRPDLRGRWTAPPLLNSNIIRLYMGDPVGRWEGDTLVADSTNFNGKVWFALGGDFATDALHIVERFTMTDSNTLKWTATLTDPNAYTRPWTIVNGAPYVRARGGDEWLEDTCHEGNADLVHLKNLYDADHTARGR